MTGRVIPFEQRGRPDRSQRQPRSPLPEPDDLDKRVESDDDRNDYRHRMKTNAAALVVVALLIWGGLWLADTLAQLRKAQDCLLSGRRNCTPITVPESVR